MPNYVFRKGRRIPKATASYFSVFITILFLVGAAYCASAFTDSFMRNADEKRNKQEQLMDLQIKALKAEYQ